MIEELKKFLPSGAREIEILFPGPDQPMYLTYKVWNEKVRQIFEPRYGLISI